MKAENEEMRAEFIKAHFQLNPNWVSDAYLWLGERFWFAATQADYVLWQAAWSASRKSLPFESLRDAIDLFRESADATVGHQHRAYIYLRHADAIESLLPAEKESDNG